MLGSKGLGAGQTENSALNAEAYIAGSCVKDEHKRVLRNLVYGVIIAINPVTLEKHVGNFMESQQTGNQSKKNSSPLHMKLPQFHSAKKRLINS